VLALVFGVAAAVMAGQLSRNRSSENPDTVPVVVAAADIERFSLVLPDQLRIKDFPKELVPPGAIFHVEDAAGRVAYVPFVKDEPVHNARLASKGAGRGLAAAIPLGMQAIAIQTPNVAVGVAGFILPGNKVDVLLTSAPHNGNNASTTITLLQNVEILAVDQRVEAPAENKIDPKELRSVTLLVTPEQAARLALGQSNGTLHLALRNPEDQRHAGTKATTLEELGFPAPEKATKEPVPAELPPIQPAVAPVAPQPVAVEAKPLPPPPVVIRTLRGTTEGRVSVRPAIGVLSDQDDSKGPQ
jgi:pilus assembly protein CpaB